MNMHSEQILTLKVDVENPGGPYIWATLSAGTQSATIDLASYDTPYKRLLLLIEDVLSNTDARSTFSYDQEGPDAELSIRPTDNPRHVFFRMNADSHRNTPSQIVSGIFDRHHLASELLKICDDPYPLDNDLDKIAAGVRRLRALL